MTTLPRFDRRWQRSSSLPRHTPNGTSDEVVPQPKIPPPATTAAAAPAPAPLSPEAKSDHYRQERAVVNIRGKNVGAIMQINGSSDGVEIAAKEDDEKERKLNWSSLLRRPLVNGNFQGVNNSFVQLILHLSDF